jgi:hypothetical protein
MAISREHKLTMDGILSFYPPMAHAVIYEPLFVREITTSVNRGGIISI